MISTTAVAIFSSINEILDLAKIEAGQLSFEAHETDLSEIVCSCLRVVTEHAHKGGVRLTLDPSSVPAIVHGDEVRLKQIVLNILSNAVKFTPAGGEVSAQIRRTGNSDTVLQIKDTGIGMRPEDIPRAMLPFQQLDNAMTKKYEGTGLGLSLTAVLMQMHGATLRSIARRTREPR